MRRTSLGRVSLVGAVGFTLAAGLALGGCIRASPNVIIVDQKTVLEQQAAGSFRGLEGELEQAGILPRPAPLSRGQMEAAGVRPGGGDDGLLEEEAISEAARIDELLLARCLGEARDGTVVETRASCTTDVDAASLGTLVERVNRGRWQIWRWLQSKRPGAGLDEVRRAWRETHMGGVVCGGQVQRDDGGWEAKKC